MPARSRTGSAIATEREERDGRCAPMPRPRPSGCAALRLEVPVKAGEKNRLFGAVTNREIAELIAKEGIEVDRHAIHLREPIKTRRRPQVDVRLHAGRRGARSPSASCPARDDRDTVGGRAPLGRAPGSAPGRRRTPRPSSRLYHADARLLPQPFRDRRSAAQTASATTSAGAFSEEAARAGLVRRAGGRTATAPRSNGGPR